MEFCSLHKLRMDLCTKQLAELFKVLKDYPYQVACVLNDLMTFELNVGKRIIVLKESEVKDPLNLELEKFLQEHIFSTST
jgi:hypothetical protein